MLDWNAYLDELLAGVRDIGLSSPDILEGYKKLGGAAGATGQLGAKVNELIALAVAVTVRCDGCIAVHTGAAIRAGASKAEIIEALGTAISVNAGAALVYSTRVMQNIASIGKTA